MVGAKNNHAKLTEDQIKEIRRIYKKGDLQFGQSALGKKYGVSHCQIGNIVKRKSWTNVD